MGIFDRFRREQRASPEDPRVPISSPQILQFFGLDEHGSAAGESVTIESALGVPAVWAAVNFISGTMAGLPLHLMRRTRSGTVRATGKLATILHDAVNDEVTSFAWRKGAFDQVLTGGRHVTFIERNQAGAVLNLWPLDPSKLTVKMDGPRRVYDYQDGGRRVRYAAADVIDLWFQLKPDGLTHRSPIFTNKDVIGQAQAATKYGSKFFQSGGVPPFAITGPFQSPGAIQRSADDLAQAVAKAAKEQRLALSLPAGHEIKPIGVDPEKSQLVELQRFVIEQVARIYSLPPTFLQDLTHGTFSNTEQQDLHFVKHTLKRWVEQFEQELNLKLFGRASTRQFVKVNVDGLLRGDFKTRMEGYAQAIQNGIMKPNEARELENRPADAQGDRLMIQGATVPLGSQPQPGAEGDPGPANDPPAGDENDGA